MLGPEIRRREEPGNPRPVYTFRGISGAEWTEEGTSSLLRRDFELLSCQLSGRAVTRLLEREVGFQDRFGGVAASHPDRRRSGKDESDLRARRVRGHPERARGEIDDDRLGRRDVVARAGRRVDRVRGLAGEVAGRQVLETQELQR